MRGIVAVVVLLTAGAAVGEETLTVMTYNIGSAARIPLGPEQMEQIADEIVSVSAELVGMTEVDIGTDWHEGRDMVGELAVALAKRGYPMHRTYTPTLRYHGGCMALVIWSRFPVVSSDFRITVVMEHEDWKVARAEVRLPDGRTLQAFMTHYWIGDGKRHQHQTDTVIEFAKEFDGPRILMGDFNLTPESSYFADIVGAGFREACQSVNGEKCPTVGGGAGKTPPGRDEQIDYIFGSEEVEFIEAYVPETTVSDHWPVVARVRL